MLFQQMVKFPMKNKLLKIGLSMYSDEKNFLPLPPRKMSGDALGYDIE